MNLSTCQLAERLVGIANIQRQEENTIVQTLELYPLEPFIVHRASQRTEQFDQRVL